MEGKENEDTGNFRRNGMEMATACFMERITAMTAADTDQEQIPVIVYSNTQIPDRSAYLLGRPQAENPVTALRQTAHF